MGNFKIQNGFNLKIKRNGDTETYNATNIDEIKEIFDVYNGENFEIVEAIHADSETGKLTDVKQTLDNFLN